MINMPVTENQRKIEKKVESITLAVNAIKWFATCTGGGWVKDDFIAANTKVMLDDLETLETEVKELRKYVDDYVQEIK